MQNRPKSPAFPPGHTSCPGRHPGKGPAAGRENGQAVPIHLLLEPSPKEHPNIERIIFCTGGRFISNVTLPQMDKRCHSPPAPDPGCAKRLWLSLCWLPQHPNFKHRNHFSMVGKCGRRGESRTRVKCKLDDVCVRREVLMSLTKNKDGKTKATRNRTPTCNAL